MRALIIICVLCFCLGPVPAKAEDNAVLTVTECVKTALGHHPDLRAAEGYVEIARTKVAQSLSQWYPQITSMSTLYHQTAQTGQGVFSPSSLTPSTIGTDIPALNPSSLAIYDYYNGGITANQLLYDFGKTSSNVLSAKENLNASEYDLLTKRLEIVFNVRQAFYQAVAAKKTLEAKAEAVGQQQEHLDQARAFFKEGTKSKIDVTKAEVDLAKARLDLIKAESSWKTSLATLYNKMGIKNEVRHDPEDPLSVEKIEIDLNEAFGEAENQRPELKKFISSIKSYRAKGKAAKVQNLPALSGIANYNWNGSQLPLPYNYYYGVQLNFTLFDGHNASALAMEAEGNIHVLEAQRASKLQDIRLEVEQAVLSLRDAEERVAVTEKSLAQAVENYDLAKGRYEVGLGTGIEFNDARVSLTGAKTDSISALTDYQIAKAKLEKALGLFRDQ
ncbi:MAG: TolC family protein [Candidatus Eremiobacteraeota bacterium]|nr:TolC family protein [Candidatus Eremiobacteraeota bacterium]